MKILNPAIAKITCSDAQQAIGENPEALITCLSYLNEGNEEELHALRDYFSVASREIARLSTSYGVPPLELWRKITSSIVKTLDFYMAEYSHEGRAAALNIIEESLLTATMEIAAQVVAHAWGESRRETAILDAMPDSYDLRVLNARGESDEFFDALLLLYRGVTDGYDEDEQPLLERATQLLDSLTWHVVLES